MNSKIFFILLLIASMVGYLFNFDKDITHFISTKTDSVKNAYMKQLTYFKDITNKYFYQLDTIEQYQTTIDKNQNFKLLFQATNNELKTLEQELNASEAIEFDTIYTKVVSYININDFSKVVIDKKIPHKSIYPLLTPEGYAAGIVLQKDDRPIAYLNNNEKCNYAVFIGNINAPGITAGVNSNGEIIIKHIPKWFNINKGDSVITSGMDHIFPTGMKVGVVTNIETLIDTKKAYIKPYTDVLTRKHFYMIKKRNTIF